jgi:hypothetical protein
MSIAPRGCYAALCANSARGCWRELRLSRWIDPAVKVTVTERVTTETASQVVMELRTTPD